MLDENNRAANQLLSDFMRVHNRLAREKKAAHSGKQPRRNKPPVHAWRSDDGLELRHDKSAARNAGAALFQGAQTGHSGHVSPKTV
jgi:hypothetical protein